MDVDSAVSDGGEDQGAEEALWGNRESFFVSFGSRLPCERLSFQRAQVPPALVSLWLGKRFFFTSAAAAAEGGRWVLLLPESSLTDSTAALDVLAPFWSPRVRRCASRWWQRERSASRSWSAPWSSRLCRCACCWLSLRVNRIHPHTHPRPSVPSDESVHTCPPCPCADAAHTLVCRVCELDSIARVNRRTFASPASRARTPPPRRARGRSKASPASTAPAAAVKGQRRPLRSAGTRPRKP